MLQPTFHPATLLAERIRARFGQRAVGIFLAVLLEALLLLLLLTLGQGGFRREEPGAVVVSFDAKDFSEQAPAPAESAEPETPQAERPAPQPPAPQPEAQQPAEPERPTPETPEPPPASASPSPSMIQLSREEMASLDVATSPARPAAPSQGPMGPPDTRPASSDTPRVEGAGPNGEPLYAASWYREPRDGELSGYLSTAQGPGWGMIACRTAPDYRVEDCVSVGEYPNGSNIARSVLEAAWQFRVRPPRIGGRPQIGEWVRIRIDYDLRRQ